MCSSCVDLILTGPVFNFCLSNYISTLQCVFQGTLRVMNKNLNVLPTSEETTADVFSPRNNMLMEADV